MHRARHAQFLVTARGLSRACLTPALVLILAGAHAPNSPGLAAPIPAQESPAKSLIYAGWFGNTTPTPDYIQANLTFLESQPFNGLVTYLRNPSMTVNATASVMTNTPISHESIASILAPLQNLSFTRLRHNFAYVLGSSPPDFFDDWSTVILNFAHLARALKEAGLRGIFFDNEQYSSPWGDYPTGTLYSLLTPLLLYQDQARLRGRQVMEAMVAEYPDIVVVTLHGPYISELSAPASLEFPQWQSGNELLGAFFSGFQEGAGSQAENVDGGELYTLRSESEFQDSYTWRKHTIASDTVGCPFLSSTLRSVWPEVVSISFGIYDQPFGGREMTPAILTETLTHALAVADKWVWLYVEGRTFLRPESEGGATQEWIDAVRSAQPSLSQRVTSTGEAVIAPEEISEPPEREIPACGLLGMETAWLLALLSWIRKRTLA
ncbi:MAG: hypothetical protein HY716_18530 [Planctomycetes bacterium]|nr:hypothetical protein [Planctomycetota bacterium]